jgi:hypothetical protein
LGCRPSLTASRKPQGILAGNDEDLDPEQIQRLCREKEPLIANRNDEQASAESATINTAAGTPSTTTEFDAMLKKLTAVCQSSVAKTHNAASASDPSSSSRKSTTCWRCGKVGHISANCHSKQAKGLGKKGKGGKKGEGFEDEEAFSEEGEMRT